MKRILILTAILIFACSSDDSSDTNDNNNNELLNCDGSPVPTIVYGTQEWTVENACHTTYRDGTPIPQVTDSDEWANLTTGAWCYYDNDPTKGILYNWYAVAGVHDNDENTPNKEFAPEGWRVPSDEEWTTLKEYLIVNGYNYDGTTMGNKIGKSMASSSGWISWTVTGTVGCEQNLNNSSGFNALPVGFRPINGSFLIVDSPDFFNEGLFSNFWCLNFNSISLAVLNSYNNFLDISVFVENDVKRNGLSVRLIKD